MFSKSKVVSSVMLLTFLLQAIHAQVTLLPSSSTIDYGQSVSFSSQWFSGGITPFTASLYNSLSTSCNSGSTIVRSVAGLTANTEAFNPVSPSAGTYYYCAAVQGNAIDINPFNVLTSSNGFSQPYSVAFSPSGTYAYITNFNGNGEGGSNTGNIVIINTATNTVVNSINNGFDGPSSVAFSPDGSYAYVINRIGGNLVIINTATNTVVNSITTGFNSPFGVTFIPNSNYAYVTNYDGNGEGGSNTGNVVIINTATNTVVNSINNGFDYPTFITAFSGNAYITNYIIGNVVIANVMSNSIIASIPNINGFLTFSPNAAYAYVNEYGGPHGTGGAVVVAKSNPFTEENYILIQKGITDAAFSPDGSYIYGVGSGNNNVIIGGGTTILLSQSSSLIVNPTPSLTVPAPSNVMLDLGQYVTYNTVLSGGTGPFTVNLMNGGTVVNTIIEPSGFSGTITFGSNIPIQGAQTFNIIATDTGTSTPFVFNSISNTIEVNSDLSTPTISASNTLVDTGQYVNFAAYEIGGMLPYTYNFIVYNSVTNIQVANMLTSSNSFLWQANGNAGNTLVANVFVTDGASTSVTVNSLHTFTITVNSVLQTPTISASNTLVDTGQYVNFAAYEIGGMLPYTYNFIVYNSVTNIQVANMLTSSNSFLWQVNGNAGNTLVANVFVTDSASTLVTVNSLHSSQIVAYSTPSASLTVQTGSGIATNSILYGNSIITTAAVTGGSGTGNFIYAFTLDNAEAQNTVSSSTLSSTNTLDALTVPGNYVFNVIVTDTGTTIYYSVPQVTNTVVVESNDLLSATSSGNPGFAGFYSAVNITFTGTPTISNQSAWSLYVNGALFGKTDSVMHWTEQGSPGTYSFTFTNPGNANYTSESLTSSLKVGSLGTGGSGVHLPHLLLQQSRPRPSLRLPPQLQYQPLRL